MRKDNTIINKREGQSFDFPKIAHTEMLKRWPSGAFLRGGELRYLLGYYFRLEKHQSRSLIKVMTTRGFLKIKKRGFELQGEVKR